MRILREDENQLIFVVYPTKYFLLFMIFLISLFVYAFFNPDLRYTMFLGRETQEGAIAGTITTAAMIIFLFSTLLVSYLIPIRVVIDKIQKTIKYRYFVYDFSLWEVREPDSIPVIKNIPVTSLHKLVYTNKLPEMRQGFHIWSLTPLAKYQFILKDNSPINIYAGFFSIFPHRYAFMKISEYLKLPYVNEFEEDIALTKSSDQLIKKSHLIKVLLMILLGLILVLVLFVGTILLIIFFRQMK